MNKQNWNVSRLISILAVFLTAGVYHAHGMNDWLTPSTIPEDVTLYQAANELMAGILLCTGLLMLYLRAPWDGE